MKTTFYDLLGVDPAAPDADTRAAALWRNDLVNATEGINLADDSLLIVRWLQSATSFDRVRTGADPAVVLGDPTAPGAGRPGQITLAADLHVASGGPPPPVLYLRQLPNVGVQLLPTSVDKPATVFFASDGRGHELVVEALPVELQLPNGLLEPIDETAVTDGKVTDFDAGDDDGIGVMLSSSPARALVRTHVRLHLRPTGEVILEPNVPISINAARLSGLPVEAIYDLLLIPNPERREYYEWARNDLGAFIDRPPARGAIGFRSIAVDVGKRPLAALAERFRDRSGVHSEDVELVLDDVVVPVTGAPSSFPIPSHGTFGIRRKITDRNSVAQAFSLANAPFRLRLYARQGSADDGQGLYLFIDELLFKTGSTASATDEAPVLKLDAGIVWQGDKGSTSGGTVTIGDDWVLQLGVTLGDKSPFKLTLASSVVSLHALRGGVRLRTIGKDPASSWQIVGDLSVQSQDAHGGTAGDHPSAFQLTTLTGKPLDIILRDVGWSFGHLSLGSSIAAPEGLQLIFAGVVRLIVEELGWVEEPGGGTYFSFSGGVSIGFGGGDAQRPTGERNEQGGNRAGIRFRRLRFLTSSTPNAAPFKLDGIFLDLRYGPVHIAGFGYISDEVDAGYRYREWGFGVQLEFPLPSVDVSLAAEFLKGARQAVADPHDGFSYFLASLQVGWIPAGPLGLYAVRLLLAYNMQPAVDPPGEGGESMALYQWHHDHDAAIEMPRSRNLADWKPVDHSFAAGVGVGLSLNGAGALFHLGAFVLVTHSEEDTGILIVADVFLLKNPEPVAFAAIEYDFAMAKFGVMAGVDLTVDKFLGGLPVPGWLNGIARLSGKIYFGNQPWSLAIGHLADQRSWLGVRIHVPLLEMKLELAAGLEITDGGPKGFGLVFSFAGGAVWGIGGFIVFGSFGLVIGTWKTGSDSAGAHAWAEVGFKIHVFFVFHFGADIGVDITYLGKHPWFTVLSAHIHIDTPWFLPDVTFKFDKTWGESQPFDTSTITQALSSGSASSPKAPGNDSHVPLHLPPLGDGNTDPSRLYSFKQLLAVPGVELTDVHGRDDIPVVAVDADVTIEFTNPVANDAAVAGDTFTGSGGDAGVQKVQDITVRYALTSIAVKRSPRFGAGAGTWTDLVAAVDTELDLAGGGSVHAAPALSFRWDADSRADGLLAPKRLLVNSRTPYSLVVGSSQNDQEALANDQGFPCCRGGRGEPLRLHVLDETAQPAGTRLPRQQQFSSGGAWWTWSTPAVTINGMGTAATGHVVALVPPGTRGSVDFPTPVFAVTVTVDPGLLSGRCVVEGYRGLTLVASGSVAGSSATSIPLRAGLDAGFTHLVLRVEASLHDETLALGRAALGIGNAGKVDGAQLLSVAYMTCDEARAILGRKARCRPGTELQPAVGGGGKLAFLPNHDYAVVPTVQVTVSHTSGGTRSFAITQPAYFRTKGLLGLNAAPNVGDELRPYVASTYPAGGTFLLYREEPVVVAFTEDLSNLLPVDRTPAPGDPPEKAQLMELTLSLERVASTEGAQRLTVPTDDWLDAHAGVVVRIGGTPVSSTSLVKVVVRRAPSTDRRVLRYERVLDAAACAHDPLHSSQVLLHEPIGPEGSPGLWEGRASLRATVRAKNGPYTQRTSFQLEDVVAFDYRAEGASHNWGVQAGALVAPGRHRQYAVFGEATWNHLQVSTTVDPSGTAAGVGVGIGSAAPIEQALLALVDGAALVIVRREAGVDHELARAALPPAVGHVTLHVTAFDDRLRARVGDVVVEGERGVVREGRVALVSDGAGRFSELLVDALEMYQLPFRTSRYASFADHIGDAGPVVVQRPDAMGAPAALTAAGVLATRATDIAGAMTPAADPQSRQALFDDVVTGLGLARLGRCDQLTITRLVDAANATTALLVESPEALSFLHDVTLHLFHRIWRRPPWWGAPTQIGGEIQQLLPGLRGDGDTPVVPPPLFISDDPVPFTLLGNGDETAALVLPGSPLDPGTYVLDFSLERSRWTGSTADPERQYQRQATVELRW